MRHISLILDLAAYFDILNLIPYNKYQLKKKNTLFKVKIQQISTNY